MARCVALNDVPAIGTISMTAQPEHEADCDCYNPRRSVAIR